MSPIPGVPFYGDNEEGLNDALYRAYLDQAEQSVYGPPKAPPQMGRSPNLGPISGRFLDDVSRGVLQGLQNSRPQGFGQNFAAGALGAFSSARQAGVEGRGQQYAAQLKAQEEEQKGRLSERSAAARSLAQHRWQMQREKMADARQTARLDAAEERDARRAAEREARDAREWARREAMQQQRMANQEKLLRLAKSMPESTARQKALRLTLSRQAENSQEAKEFLVVRDYYNQGIKSLKAADNYGDLMAIRSLAKVSDKLTGIREGEQLSFEKAQGELLRAGMITPKMLGRGSFTPAARAAIARELKNIYDNKLQYYRNAKDHYRTQATLLDLPNPESIMLDLEAGSDSTGAKQSGFDPEDL